MSYPWLAQAAHNKAAVREGLKIVRKVIARDAVKTPLSTATIYKLAVREPPPPTFALTIPESDETTQVEYLKSGRRRTPAPNPPHPRHPVRSLSFLKHSLLPIIAGERRVQHVRETRLVVHQSKAEQKAAAARGNKQPTPSTKKSAEPVQTMVWLWQATKPPSRVVKPTESVRTNVYDYSHMKASKRKAHKARLELAEKRAELEARRKLRKLQTRREADRKVNAEKREEAKLRHQEEERAGLLRKAERRKRWETSNPILAKALAKKKAEDAQRLAQVMKS
ncbi:hypothetical protein R3P38DRAFT_2607960 [Favolaschia claudopus]|uniref:Uncharacterized protein n=1 Tax=Favolaschia claudopus TaxID=2862362 RepID=A0AAW0D9N1_9AGAR